ncbi:unnamed protein product [Vitrella brassicaformis CCMP3155]|uniref:SH3 domain-containing protein n=1 Tax=Vitrella brassicaformis (strain CCMP3155) TaxID=1169540 RepID=A0A0G4GMG3_VITBC|nr:unnamed protein product [Vitrella brassicaformis CCMP3155]|eukprot:CEM31319.1 unnamed protein product [Vitrella brassicaformis CCMP3155]
MAAVSSASACHFNLPHLPLMPPFTRYREGTRVLMVSKTKREGKHKWVTAVVDRRPEETSRGTKVHMTEVAGCRERFEVLVPAVEVTIAEEWTAEGGGGQQLSLAEGTRVRIQERHSSGWTLGLIVRPDDTLDNRPDSWGWFPDFLTGLPPSRDTTTPPNKKPKTHKAPDGFADDHQVSLFGFMTPRELSAIFPHRSPIRNGAVHQHTHATIDAATDADRRFWSQTASEAALKLGRRLVNLITLKGDVSCLDNMMAVVEGHAAGRQHKSEGSLETITFSTGSTGNTSISRRAEKRQRPPTPPLLTEPPTLPSLKAVTGAVRHHSDLANRGWRMPSLETVEQTGWGPDELGSFISSSRCLQRVGGQLWGKQWAAVLEHIPKAAAGQPGPLRQLQSIGMIEHRDGQTHQRYQAGVERLKDVLTSRGCRKSLKELHVQIPPLYGHTAIDSLVAVDSLVKECCTPDARITVTSTPHPVISRLHRFDLSLFYSDAIPSHPSPFFMMAIQAAAREATQINYVISQHDLTHPVDSPSQAAIDIAKTLTFDKAERVIVRNAHGFDPPPGAPSPQPTIINHLQQFLTGTELYICSALGDSSGRLLAEKMPRMVEWVWIGRGVSSGGMIGVLEGLGAGTEVGSVNVDEVSLTGGALDGWRSDGFPSIGRIGMHLSVPDGLGASAAAELIRGGISSIVGGVRSLRSLTLTVHGSEAVRDAVREAVRTEVSDNFTIGTRSQWGSVEVTATRRS